MDRLELAIIRSLAFNAAWGYAPTRLQLAMGLDLGDAESDRQNIRLPETTDIWSALDGLVAQGKVAEEQGRVALAAFADHVRWGRSKEFLFPRKLRKARQAAAYLRRLPWVRAVCLCNTTALGQARDQGDLDFFVIAKAGTIWRTRFFSVLPFKLLGARPSPVIPEEPAWRRQESMIDEPILLDPRLLEDDKKTAVKKARPATDPVCLSFFITDDGLDLSRFMLPGDDPYFRYWFLSLLPLYDDGVLKELWRQNGKLVARHPYARCWMVLDGDDLIKAAKKGPPVSSWLESRLKAIQLERLPVSIRRLANQDTCVKMDDKVLKFHVDDQRAAYRERYYALCREHGVEP